MKNGKIFFGKLLIAAGILVLADIGIGRLMHHFYFRITHGEQGRMTYVIDSTRAPLLVIGSSRAAHHYVSAILADSLHTGCYNAGKDWQGLFYNLAMIKMILHRYKPQTILLDLTPISFAASEASLDKLDVLLPYYHQHPEIQPVFDKKGPAQRILTLSSLYCYNSLILQIIFNNRSRQIDEGIVNGYIPKMDTLNHPPFQPYSDEELFGKPDTALVNAFREILTLTRLSNCRLAVVVSPVYFPLYHSTSTIQLAKKICDTRQIPFFDYTCSAIFNGKTGFFTDEQHLNNAGAERFTRILCSDLAAKGFRETVK